MLAIGFIIGFACCFGVMWLDPGHRQVFKEQEAKNREEGEVDEG